MSESIKHECGIAFLRLRKPAEFYLAKYGNPVYALQKMSLLMEKQHNRGQDGAGIACVKLDMSPGKPYINRIRNNSSAPIIDTFNQAFAPLREMKNARSPRYLDLDYLKENIPFTGEVFLGHLRYGTFGKNDIKFVHPFIRPNNWKTRNLILAGNFNMTNAEELFNKLIEMGQQPVETADTVTIMEQIGYYLDEENDKLYQQYKAEGMPRMEISQHIAKELDIASVLRKSSKLWDGGYVLSGMVGNGDAFVMRDPSGIRPAFYYANDEIVVATSERPVIQTAFNIHYEDIQELLPGQALIVKSDGSWIVEQIIEPKEEKYCSFERIYFSRGTDADIYKERKKLGRLIVPQVLEAIDFDVENTVFSFIPNTAIVAFMGMYASLLDFTDKVKRDKIMALKNPTAEAIDEILKLHPRAETVAVKDMKMRTFITTDKERDDLVDHIYDVTYGLVRNGVDNLVVIDDSIVRGTTLRQSIIKILDRLEPKSILVASSAPQIRYPDCYGIDMAKLGDFIAFRAAIELLHDTKQTNIIDEVYKLCKEQINKPKEEMVNHVKRIYKPFTAQQISEKIATMITPKNTRAKISVVFQSIENLHLALKTKGDWYFTGDYPTPGGNRVVTQSFINYVEGRNERAY
ncbi:Amidophosphoribosyltransferase [bioreactor metagenome]|uniref:Amidophosphoribosyltransferase n=1 Tax=bioreactor metagenome TaxID=1076179 RepID=A0A644XZ73_9ZZZZ